MKIGLLISIREKSKRLPGKVLKLIQEKTVTELLIERMKLAQGFDNLIIATSDDPRDMVFGQIAVKYGIDVFFGDQEDKLFRYLQVTNHFNLDAVIIVDGDDILCFPEIVTENTKLLRKGLYDVVFWKSLPLGAASSALTKKALERVMPMKAENDTEVWGGYFTKGDFKVHYAISEIGILKHPEVRLTLDYQEDYDLFSTIFDELYPVNPDFTSIELMNLLINTKPELLKLNVGAQFKYEEHLKKAAPVKFK